MNSIYYTQKQLDDFDMLGKGAFAFVYYDKQKKKAIKVYQKTDSVQQEDVIHILNMEERLANNSVLEAFGIVIPEDKVYVNTEYLGISMYAVNGFTLKQLSTKKINTTDKINFFTFLKAYYHLKRNVGKIGKMKFKMDDLNSGNVMWDYDKERLVIVDTQLIRKFEDRHGYTLKRQNKREYARWNRIVPLVKNKVFTLKRVNKIAS